MALSGLSTGQVGQLFNKAENMQFHLPVPVLLLHFVAKLGESADFGKLNSCIRVGRVGFWGVISAGSGQVGLGYLICGSGHEIWTRAHLCKIAGSRHGRGLGSPMGWVALGLGRIFEISVGLVGLGQARTTSYNSITPSKILDTSF